MKVYYGFPPANADEATKARFEAGHREQRTHVVEVISLRVMQGSGWDDEVCRKAEEVLEAFKGHELDAAAFDRTMSALRRLED
ncbi:hypothetical protein BB934_45395 (plasmid) [Microvirga ossetica]|uniref:Uncharacterized protein n=1 Tax=Microvirga ossetica TaxID=1882682 RepID=A0A1B2EZV1_9HYPH|nr:hypothetical protein [Microvirga ossetica]ANY85457.1 hypothetical protein BB934_45395 [Microvirga ossetica]